MATDFNLFFHHFYYFYHCIKSKKNDFGSNIEPVPDPAFNTDRFRVHNPECLKPTILHFPNGIRNSNKRDMMKKTGRYFLFTEEVRHFFWRLIQNGDDEP
jgi:hypothetical protein